MTGRRISEFLLVFLLFWDAAVEGSSPSSQSTHHGLLHTDVGEGALSRTRPISRSLPKSEKEGRTLVSVVRIKITVHQK